MTANLAQNVFTTRSAAEPEQSITPNVTGEVSSKEIIAEKQNHREHDEAPQLATEKKSFRFFAIIAALALSGLLTSLEATITSTALPTITADLGGANLYVWVVNGFYLTQYGPLIIHTVSRLT